jgi:hypothetical protein
MSTADAVTREAVWLSRSGDGLPALLSETGGPWDVINGYWPRTPSYRINGIYVLRSRLQDIRISNQRKRPAHQFRLKLIWVVGSTTTAVGIAETEQFAFDTAVDLLLHRIRGTLGNKTHGGAFLSVGETPGRSPEISVDFDPPETTMDRGFLSGTVIYSADDLEDVI